MRSRLSLLISLLICAILCGCSPSKPSVAKITDAEAESEYRALSQRISPARLEEFTRALAIPQSRLTGSAGEAQTFQAVRAEFQRIGLQNIRSEPFKVTVPDPDARGSLTIEGQISELYPLWPNVVRTSTCNVTGKLLYGGLGRLEDFDAKDVQGAIVLLEFNSGTRWKNAGKLGAAAVIFLEPNGALRSEAEQKFGAVPLSLPRFYLPLNSAGPVLNAAFARKTASLRCRQEWVLRESQNLLADLPGTDPSLQGERVIVAANADSMSVVPSLAPGADGAASVSSLLELARLWKGRPPKRPLTFMLSGAHALGLQGAREFVDRRLTTDQQPLLLINTIDLSTGSSVLATYGRGWFYEYRDEVREPMKNFSRLLRSHADHLAPVLGESNARLILTDSINNSDNRTWKNNIPARFAFDCEPFLLGGYNSLTFATIEDARDRVDTPFDTIDHVDFDNLTLQTKTLAAMIGHSLNDPIAKGVDTDYKVPLDVTGPSALRLTGGFATVDGYVAVYDPAKSFVPDSRITDAVVVAQNAQKTMMGVRGPIIQRVQGKEATYRIPGLPLINSYSQRDEKYFTSMAAFRLDQQSGDIDYAVDFGIMGAIAYPTEFELKTTSRTAPIVVFKCRAVDFYSLVDPQDLRTFRGGFIMDAKTNGDPQYFGFFVPMEDMRLSSETDDTACLFMPPDSRFKMLFGSGMNEFRLMLTNSTPDDESGQGFRIPGGPRVDDRSGITQGGRLPDTALHAAQDIVAINESRLREFAKYRIISTGIRELQTQAKSEIGLATAAKNRMEWSEEDRHARAAWGYALRAHPVIAKTTGDVVNGVIFYLFLIIPFSYFIERLFFANRALTKQLTVGIAIFIASFLVLRLIHTAFEIVKNPMMIFIAFVMGTLSIVVGFFILGKFEASLKTLRQLESGVHEVDIQRGSVAMAAFNLGVSNMRRRKARTFLTTLTLVVMTFIVLSFTSIVPDLQVNELSSDNPARYPGMLVRNANLDPLQSATYRQLSNEFMGKGDVLRRTTYYGADIVDTGMLTIRRGPQVTEVRAMVGFDPAESKATRPQEAMLPGGRWFKPDDRWVTILPQLLAKKLKIESKDLGNATIDFAGHEYTVIGLIDENYMRSIQDLDGDGIMAPDFSLSRQFQSDLGTANQAFKSFLRVDPSSCFLVPAETSLASGADLRSIAVVFQEPRQTRTSLKALMPRLRLNLYASVPKPGSPDLEVKQFSILQASKGTGLALVLVQLVIAAVFVLNTMIASVFERTKEIAIFSSIGLAPNHIAMLFFAESLVYGILGTVFGYFLAQFAAKIIVATGILPSLYLNFSSSSAVMSAGLVMATVLGSTIYPARKASQIAAPAQAEESLESEPEGDLWRIRLPFSISSSEAAPLTEFLGEWLMAYEGYTIGEFVSSETTIRADGEDYIVESTIWVAPYDLGVSQHLLLRASPGQAPGTVVLDLTLNRLGGEVDNWETVNKRFLASIRKQFLTWRTLDAAQRSRYSASALERFGDLTPV